MKSNYKPPKQFSYHRIIASILTTSISVCVGLAALASTGDSAKPDTQTADQGIPVHVQNDHSNAPQKRIDLDARINKMRKSAPKLSLPSTLFEPWWQTMFHDPDSEWLMRNFDIMSSDPEKVWSFPLGSGAFIPRVDIDSTDQIVKLSAEVPGIDEKNLEVTISDNTVSIKGEKQEEKTNTSGKAFQSIERHYGSFERTVALPCKVDSDKAEAKLKNGILTVIAPKAYNEKSETKKLTIKRE